MFDFFAAVEASGSGGTATNVLCGGADVLRVVRFAFRILDIGFFIIPILVVLLTTISFGKNVIAKNADDMNKEIPVVIRRIIYCVVIFLLPLFVEAVVKLLGNINILDFKYYSTCYSIAKSDDDLSKFEVIYPEIEGDVTTDTNTSKSYTPTSDDDDSSSVGSGDSANNVDEAKDEQGDLRKKQQAKNLSVFIGDSRICGMQGAVNTRDGEWICQDGAGYNWLIDDAEKQLDDFLKDKTNVKYTIYINLGVNDLGTPNIVDHYISKYRDMTQKYSQNHKVVIVSVNPVNNKKAVRSRYSVKNENVDDFNKKLKKASGINYCDTYSTVSKDYETVDGVHYSNATYKKIYKLMLNCV